MRIKIPFSRPRPAILAVALYALLSATPIGCRGEQANPEELLRARSLGLNYLQRDMFDEAEAQFKQIIALAPREWFGYANLGLTYMRADRLKEAEDQLSQARKLEPKNADILLMLARLYAETNRDAEARKILEQVVANDSQSARARFGLAELDARDSTQRALPAYDARLAEVLAIEPGNIAVRLKLANALVRRGLADSAASQLEEIRRTPPEPPADVAPLLATTIERLRAMDIPGALVPLGRVTQLMEVSAPYQVALQRVQWIEGPLTGRPILSFLPQSVVERRGQGIISLTNDSVLFVDATREVGLPSANGATGTPTTSAEAGAPGVIVTGDFNGDGMEDALVRVGSGVHLLQVGRFRSVDVTGKSGLIFSSGINAAAVGDMDNDGWLDLYVVGVDGRGALWHNKGDGTFDNVTSKSGTQDAAGVRDARFVDLDHDGDLDLLLVGGSANRVYRNNLDGTFAESARAMGLAGHADGRASAIGDIDGDGRIDIVVAYAGDGVVIYRNSAGEAQRFSDVTAASGITTSGGAHDVTVVDYDNDGILDIAVVPATGDAAKLWRGTANGSFVRDTQSDRAIASLTGVANGRISFVDVDNDGWLDLLYSGTPSANGRGLRLLVNTGKGSFTDQSARLPASIASSGMVVPIDIDADGDEDLLVAGTTQASLLLNEGGNTRMAMRVQLKGLRAGSGKNNDFGLGATLKLRVGALLQTRVVTSGVTTFGLGDHLKADVLRIEWPNGVPQTVYFPGTDQDVLEVETLKGSCAFLYTWNGEKFEFVTDVMWRSALGMPVGIMATAPVSQTVYAPAGASTEYLRIPRSALQPKDGQYVLQFTEELWETAYADEIKLLTVDHPDSVQVFVDERFVPPGPTTLRIFEVTRAHAPRSATDALGSDVLPALQAADHVYVSKLTPTRYQGVVETHELILDLGDDAGVAGSRLFLRGWIFPTDASINLALAQQTAMQVQSPSLEVRDTRGNWKTVTPNIGFPSGKDKTLVIDLDGIFPTKDRHVRVRTNMQIYWDHAFVAHDVATPSARVATLVPQSAVLRERGYSRMYRAGGRTGPFWFDYDSVTTVSPWRPITGAFTRFGDVTPLVNTSDDKFVVMAPGDETTLHFDATSEKAIPNGWTRDFLLYSDGWIKDSDLNTAFGNSVEPLPFQAIKRYPYAPGEAYPTDTSHARYLREYNTRIVKQR